MSEITRPTAFKVVITEHERGWGSRVDGIKYFDNEQEARDYCTKFNSRNTEKVAPDWYMVADYCGKV